MGKDWLSPRPLFFAFPPFAVNRLPFAVGLFIWYWTSGSSFCIDLFGRVMMINAATDADDLPSLFVCGIANVSTYKFLQSVSSLEWKMMNSGS